MKKKTCVLLLCAAVLLSSSVTYLLTTKKYKREIEFCRDNADLLNVYEEISTKFYKEISKENLLDYMIKGCVEACDEDYCDYFTPDMITEKRVNENSSVSRSGFAVDKNRQDLIVVTEVDEGSRAEEMGLEVGDIITSIDGEDVREKGYYKAIRDLLGKDGTKMTLHIRRGKDTELDIEFIRDNTVPEAGKSMYCEIMENDILYIGFDYFNANYLEWVKKTLSENKYRAIIFDIRNNSGGETWSTVEMFDLFAEEGNRVLTREERTGKELVYETTTDGKEIGCPVAVLVNENSISSAEIFAMFFKDTGKGTLIGTKTKGKGIFQNNLYLSNMLTYSYTAGYYYVNDLPNYDGIGVYPDITVEMDESLKLTPDDVQLQKAIEILG